MNADDPDLVRQIADVVRMFQKQTTGCTPKKVTVVFGEDILVATLHDTLSPAEKALAHSAAGAARVQEFHRNLFATSSEQLRRDIRRITGREVRETIGELDTESGSIMHAFTTGTMVQIFLFASASQAQ